MSQQSAHLEALLLEQVGQGNKALSEYVRKCVASSNPQLIAGWLDALLELLQQKPIACFIATAGIVSHHIATVRNALPFCVY
jgi:hypothetical protein